ncbi:MAG: hypothetical protein HDS67_04700 [Bacteroidales bacterium]|nr:hypothetical protein [Bacteroidales bacterium]
MKSICRFFFPAIVALVAVGASGCSDEYTIDPPNSSKTLGFKNYDGNSQNIHPKVLYFPEGWSGWEYWMAYTPYPDGVVDQENPCIAVSHDGYKWTVPRGLTNPLDPQPSYGYNSDTHLVYREDRDELEIWWRDFNELTARDSFLRRTSRDGVNWTPEERVLPFGAKRAMYRLSPAVMVEGDRYLVYYCDGRKVLKMFSGSNFDTGQWSEPETVPIDFGDIKAWHLDVVENAEGLHEMIICCYGPGGGNNSADLYYCVYDPERNTATDPVMILGRSDKEGAIDEQSIYRSSIVYVDDFVRIYYSCIDRHDKRHLSVTEGPSVFDLRGFRGMSR